MAVLGAGPLGLMMIHLAALHGCEAIAIVKHPAQAAAAKALGAAHVIEISAVEDPVQAVRALTPSHHGVDIAIEAVALAETWQQAVAMTRNGGTVNFFGGPAAGTTVSLDTNRLHYGDLTLKATFHHTPAICRRAFDLIASGRFQAARFITGQAPLADLNHAFADLMDRGQDGQSRIKTAILPARP
uniref:Alcohol dehydrogenase, zinc-binding n=1 Tax=mine drainage metagenome TaxID=410659 RepID=E6PYZ1_9ZZZZ